MWLGMVCYSLPEGSLRSVLHHAKNLGVLTFNGERLALFLSSKKFESPIIWGKVIIYNSIMTKETLN
jgi:hypothetical protein